LTARRPALGEGWVWSQLIDLARRLGIAVIVRDLSDDDFSTPGGLCRVGGTWRLLLHRRLSVAERNQVLAAALGRFDLETVYIVPRLRGFIESARGERQSENQ
jgi:hypothetical protein